MSSEGKNERKGEREKGKGSEKLRRKEKNIAWEKVRIKWEDNERDRESDKNSYREGDRWKRRNERKIKVVI